jgi:hypothetical protein
MLRQKLEERFGVETLAIFDHVRRQPSSSGWRIRPVY